MFHLQNLRDGLTPNIKRLQNLAQPQQLHVSESGVGLLQVGFSQSYFRSNFLYSVKCHYFSGPLDDVIDTNIHNDYND